MPAESKKTEDQPAGTMIPEPKPGDVFAWLAERLPLTALVRVCNAFLNLIININVLLPDGTYLSQGKVRPKIANGNSVVDLNIDLSQSGLQMEGSGTTVIPGTFYNIASTANPGVDDYRCVQFRDILVGLRSKYYTGTGEDITTGNFESRFYALNDLQAILGDPFGQPAALPTQTILDNTAATTLYDPTILDASCGQIILNDTATDLTGNISAAFWLEIVDDPSFGPYAKLIGRMYDSSGTAPGRVTSPFPAGTENIVPLATIVCNATTDPFIRQIQTGNLVNRYPAGTTRFRGRWTADALANRVFYQGEQVLDDSVVNRTIGGVSFYALWQYNNGSGQEATAPNTTPTHWIKLYAVPAAA